MSVVLSMTVPSDIIEDLPSCGTDNRLMWVCPPVKISIASGVDDFEQDDIWTLY